jgi:hypothetical protein
MSIIFYVKVKKRVQSKLELPKYVSGRTRDGRSVQIPTDVIEMSGKPVLFNLQAARKIKGYFNDVGVSALTFASRRGKFVVTNAHVVASVTHQGQSGEVTVYDQSGTVETGYGTVVVAAPLLDQEVVEADVALVQLNNSESVDSWSIDTLGQKIRYVRDLAPGDQTHHFVYRGQLYECANPVFVPSEANAIVSIDGVDLHYGEFWRLTMRKGDSLEGQSGSLIFRSEADGLIAVGIGFGGIDPGEIWAFSAKTMWNYLKLGNYTD